MSPERFNAPRTEDANDAQLSLRTKGRIPQQDVEVNRKAQTQMRTEETELLA